MAYKRRGNPQLILRLSKSDLRRLDMACEQQAVTRSDLVREAIRRALDDLQIPSAPAEQVEGQVSIDDETET